MKDERTICKECKQVFKTTGGLHKHLKVHGYYAANYYIKHYPRKNKLNGTLLPYKNYRDYFEKDFESRIQFDQWCNAQILKGTEYATLARTYVFNKIKDRIEEKELKFAPPHLEFKHSFLPDLSTVRKLFGSYSHLSKELKKEPLFGAKLPKGFWGELPKDLNAVIDTREQQPLKFKNISTSTFKLDVGDYTLDGDYFNNTFVDRKSGNDFIATLNSYNGNLERFERELQRVSDSECYLFIVIESNFIKMKKDAQRYKRKVNIDYLAHTFKELMHSFPRRCQFVFANDRKTAADLILRLLYFGPEVYQTDIQYVIDN